jgi:hypothetical protein
VQNTTYTYRQVQHFPKKSHTNGLSPKLSVPTSARPLMSCSQLASLSPFDLKTSSVHHHSHSPKNYMANPASPCMNYNTSSMKSVFQMDTLWCTPSRCLKTVTGAYPKQKTPPWHTTPHNHRNGRSAKTTTRSTGSLMSSQHLKETSAQSRGNSVDTDGSMASILHPDSMQ